MATKNQLATRVLQKLMVLEHGETVDTDDLAIVVAAYDSSYALLDSNNLVTWTSDGDIPVGAELPMINYVAEQIKGAFSIPQDVRVSLPFEADKAEEDLATLVAGDYVPQDTPGTYF